MTRHIDFRTGGELKFEVSTIISGQSGISFTDYFNELEMSILGLSESKIGAYFTTKSIGSRHKSLASTVRALVLNDLQLKGWTINWRPFKGRREFDSALWSFDAAKHIVINGSGAWLTIEISFDNRVSIGTHLVKSTVANSLAHRSEAGQDPVVHHCIVAASKSFKDVAGIDGSVASSEEFVSAAGPYASLGLTRTTILSLSALETIEVIQRKFDGRTKSKLLSLEVEIK